MRVLYVITQGELGGAQLYVRALANAARSQNWTVDAAIGDRNNNCWLSQKITSLGGQIWHLDHLKRPFAPFDDVIGVFELAKLYQKIRPDIIHLNSSKAGILGSLAFLIFKIGDPRSSARLIYTVHGWVFNEPMPWIMQKIYRLMEKITAPLKTKIICVSEFDRQVAIKSKISAPNKLITIHNGIDLPNEYFLDKITARQKIITDNTIDQKEILIGVIANFYATKGLSYLIDAIKIIITDYQLPITAIIIGDGDLRSELESQIKQLDLQNNIILTGKIKDAAKCLKAFDIAVMSSVKEGFPYFLLEAMSAGLPIVSTNVGGIPEINVDNETGFLVAPKNPEDLAKKIKLMIDSPELQTKFVAVGLARVTNEFNLEKMIKETFMLYNG